MPTYPAPAHASHLPSCLPPHTATLLLHPPPFTPSIPPWVSTCPYTLSSHLPFTIYYTHSCLPTCLPFGSSYYYHRAFTCSAYRRAVLSGLHHRAITTIGSLTILLHTAALAITLLPIYTPALASSPPVDPLPAGYTFPAPCTRRWRSCVFHLLPLNTTLPPPCNSRAPCGTWHLFLYSPPAAPHVYHYLLPSLPCLWVLNRSCFMVTPAATFVVLSGCRDMDIFRWRWRNSTRRVCPAARF